jgi:hypothetical protein
MIEEKQMPQTPLFKTAVDRYSPMACAHFESPLLWLCIPQLPSCSFTAVATYACTVKYTSNITLHGAIISVYCYIYQKNVLSFI